jgi:HEAT repeat protein
MDDTLDLGLVPESNLRDRTRGSAPYEVARQGESVMPLARIRQAAMDAQGGEATRAKMKQALADPDPAVRYWGCIGLAAQGKVEASSIEALEAALSDPSPTVRMAAADGLVRRVGPQQAVPVLVAGLQDDNEWVRLQAIHGLDRLGKQAQPVASSIEAATQDSNDYVRRVAEHALAAFK